MNAPPTNVKPGSPTDPPDDWSEQEQEWTEMNRYPIRGQTGNPGFYPLTIKFGYVFGIMYSIWQSVACLLENKEFAKESSYIPAYGLFASGIELLGRCVAGKTKVHASALTEGLQWLAKPKYSCYQHVLDATVLVYTTTKTDGYSIRQLSDLRHFAAHGQGTSEYQVVDFELINELRDPVKNGLEDYWGQLQESDELCNNLARANIVPLHKSAVMKTWFLFGSTRTGHNESITTLLDEFKHAFRV